LRKLNKGIAMPFYDIGCSHCDGIFEKMLLVSDLHKPTQCPYCKQQTAAAPTLNAARVGMKIVDSWRPKNKAEVLAGAGVAGPGTSTRAVRSSVLHNCKGHDCSICET
jgi:putative FmdB family regulatory protein